MGGNLPSLKDKFCPHFSQNLGPKYTVYNTKISNEIFWIRNDPSPPFGTFPKKHPFLRRRSSLKENERIWRVPQPITRQALGQEAPWNIIWVRYAAGWHHFLSDKLCHRLLLKTLVTSGLRIKCITFRIR